MTEKSNYYLDSVVEEIEKLKVQLNNSSTATFKQLVLLNRQIASMEKMMQELLKVVKNRD